MLMPKLMPPLLPLSPLVLEQTRDAMKRPVGAMAQDALETRLLKGSPYHRGLRVFGLLELSDRWMERNNRAVQAPSGGEEIYAFHIRL